LSVAAASTIVDLHAHFWPPSYCPVGPEAIRLSLGPDGGGTVLRRGEVIRSLSAAACDVEARVALLDELGIDQQVLMPFPFLLPSLDLDWDAKAPELNRCLARACEEAPDRLQGFGVVSANDSPTALRAALSEIKDLGLGGVAVGTAWILGSRLAGTLDASLEAIGVAGLRMHVHPTRTFTADLATGPLRSALASASDSAEILGCLLLDGTLTHHPDLNVCWSHGGGALPWLLPRLEKTGAEMTAGWVLPKNLFLDSAGLNLAQLQYVRRQVGVDGLCFGSDLPGISAAYVQSALTGLVGDSDLAQCMLANTRRFFGQPTPTAANTVTARGPALRRAHLDNEGVDR